MQGIADRAARFEAFSAEVDRCSTCQDRFNSERGPRTYCAKHTHQQGILCGRYAEHNESCCEICVQHNDGTKEEA